MPSNNISFLFFNEFFHILSVRNRYIGKFKLTVANICIPSDNIVKQARVGKTAKYGFLTQRQRDYLEGKICLPAKNRKVMNYRIRKAVKKAIDDVINDCDILENWEERNSSRHSIKEYCRNLARVRSFAVLQSTLKSWKLRGIHSKGYSTKEGNVQLDSKKISIPLACECGRQWSQDFYKDEKYGAYKSKDRLHPLFYLDGDLLAQAFNLELKVPEICQEALKAAIEKATNNPTE
jgi:hypothetical protein